MRTSSAKMIYLNPASDIMHSVKTTPYDQNNTSFRCKKVQSDHTVKELFSLVCYFFALTKPSSVLNYLKTAFILTNPGREIAPNTGD